eukprot:COSAG06_NODE_63231_length_263_cov_0.426829_1_plen_57_part_01
MRGVVALLVVRARLGPGVAGARGRPLFGARGGLNDLERFGGGGGQEGGGGGGGGGGS